MSEFENPGPAPVDEAPEALEVPAPPQTGDDAVDAALHELAAAAGDASRPLEAQVTAFEHAHRALQDRLADVEG